MTAAAATPRAILNAWLNSTRHRQNLFRSDWREQGAAVLMDVDVGEASGVTVWVSQFGVRG